MVSRCGIILLDSVRMGFTNPYCPVLIETEADFDSKSIA
jgi:hypothetical protein